MKNVFNEEEGEIPRASFIGTPFNVQHNTHVRPDQRASTGFSGLPPAWRAVLKASGITKKEAVENPQAVLDVLTFHMEGPKTLPSRNSLKMEMSTAALVRNEDPLKYYGDLKKLGQGASGVVYSAVEKATGHKF